MTSDRAIADRLGAMIRDGGRGPPARECGLRVDSKGLPENNMGAGGALTRKFRSQPAGYFPAGP
jgi:hypothetical protein